MKSIMRIATPLILLIQASCTITTVDHVPFKKSFTSNMQKDFAIAWDFDGIIFKPLAPGPLSQAKLAWHALTTLSSKSWLPAAKQFWKHGKGSAITWHDLCNELGDKKGARYFEDMMLNKKIYSETVKLIRRLDQKGYLLFAASNQDIREIKLQIAKRKELHPIAECFTDGVQVDTSPGKEALQKPDPAYFKELKAIMRLYCGPDTQLVFIDDKIENVEVARKEGFIGIHCASPSKLWKQLLELGIRV